MCIWGLTFPYWSNRDTMRCAILAIDGVLGCGSSCTTHILVFPSLLQQMVSTGGKKETPVCPHIWDNEAVIWTMAVGLLLSTLVYLEHLYSGQEWIGDDAAEPEQAPPVKTTSDAVLYFDDSELHADWRCHMIRKLPREIRPCKLCGAEPCEEYIITAWGKCYHTRDSCRGLNARNKSYPLCRATICVSCSCASRSNNA